SSERAACRCSTLRRVPGCFFRLGECVEVKVPKNACGRCGLRIVRVRFWSPFEISVYPVLRTLKHAAHEALVSHGLPHLRDWMLRQGLRTTTMFASCSIVFSPPSQRVHIQEHDHVA